MILLAGLALGIGRSIWIDDRLEAASAKKPATSASAHVAAISDGRSSIQSSIDRAYIPPEPEQHEDTKTQEKNLPLSMDAGPVGTVKPIPPEAKAQPEPVPVPKPVPAPAKAQNEPPLRIDKTEPNKATPSRSGGSTASALEKERKSGAATSSAKLASAERKERIKEIDRVRTQAFSETSKDRTGERKTSSPATPVGPQSQKRSSFQTNKVSQSLVSRSQYARCERIDHIIRREQCKWQLCNNKWGKGACPSFRHEKPFLF